MMERLKKADSLSTYEGGFAFDFDTIQLAGKFKDAVLSTFSEYKGQINAAMERAAELGIQQEVEI